jgi:hypothetical protein
MNLKEELLKERDIKRINKMVNYIGNDHLRFKELMDIYFGKEDKASEIAAWVLGKCAEEQPELLKPYVSKLITLLAKKNRHDAIKRNGYRVLQFQDIPERDKGRLLAQCYEAILSLQEAIAIRVFALSTAYNISKDFPELLQELLLMLDDILAHPHSPALLARARMIKKDIKKREKGKSVAVLAFQ